MIFESYVYIESPKKVKEDNLFTLGIGASIVLFILAYIFIFRGIAFIIMFIVMSYALIQLKLNDNKKKGANRLGRLVDRLTLTRDLLTIGDRQFKVTELNKFDIDADDFLGKSTGIFGTSAGIDNFMTFTQDKTDYSFQFQVENRNDLKLLSAINREIKN